MKQEIVLEVDHYPFIDANLNLKQVFLNQIILARKATSSHLRHHV